MALSERIVIYALVALALGRALVAALLPLHGDEAFYWWESLRPALGYSDLPPLTAWLLALTAWSDGGYLGVRWAFLLLGTLLPVGVYALAREFWARRAAAGAALTALALPLVGLQGLLALPDVLINGCAVLLALGLVRGLDGRAGGWALAGVALALGFATHPRFAVPALAGALAVLASADGRRALRGPGPWFAALCALAGLLPTLLFELRHGGVMLSFQLADRHPWRFQAEGLLQPVVQALVATPLLYLLLILAAVALLRRPRRPGRWDVLAWLGILPPVLYFSLGLFADQERVGFHWPLVGYLPLCAAVPLLAGRPGPRRLARAGVALGLAVAVGLLALLALLARWPERDWPLTTLLPVNLVGWPAVADAVPQAPGPLVADNFMLAAQLAFERRRSEVFSLDHPRNRRHGRAAQLALWSLDEDAIPDGPGILVVEETALPPAERPAWARRLCTRFPDAALVAEVSQLAGRRRFRVFRYGEDAARCDHPAFAYVDAPRAGATVGPAFAVRGWAFDEDAGLASVEVLVDGQVRATAERTPRADVAPFFGGVADPDAPGIGFEARIEGLSPGRYELGLRLTGRDGRVRTTVPQAIVVAAGP